MGTVGFPNVSRFLIKTNGPTLTHQECMVFKRKLHLKLWRSTPLNIKTIGLLLSSYYLIIIIMIILLLWLYYYYDYLIIVLLLSYYFVGHVRVPEKLRNPTFINRGFNSKEQDLQGRGEIPASISSPLFLQESSSHKINSQHIEIPQIPSLTYQIHPVHGDCWWYSFCLGLCYTYIKFTWHCGRGFSCKYYIAPPRLSELIPYHGGNHPCCLRRTTGRHRTPGSRSSRLEAGRERERGGG